jgi:hypothetical protein
MSDQTVISYFNTHYSIIVLIWFLIICAKIVQMAVGLHAVFHLKQRLELDLFAPRVTFIFCRKYNLKDLTAKLPKQITSTFT